MTETRAQGRRLSAAALACAVFAPVGVRAQAAAAVPPAPSASSAQAADRAQKESDRTLYWIRVLADKPAAKAAPAPRSADASTRSPQTEAAKPAAGSRAGNAASPARSTTTAGAEAAPASLRAASVARDAAPPTSTRVAAAPLAEGALIAPALVAPTPEVPAPAIEKPDPGLVLTQSVDPKFPIPLMMRLRKGQVEVRFEVDEKGQVTAASVEHSTHHGLENAALDAVRQWRFKPTPHGHAALVDLAFNMDS